MPFPTRSLRVAAVVFAAALAAVACAPTATLNALAPSDTHTRIADIAYGPLPRQKLDVYRPTSVAPPGGFPVAVFFYGGSWNRGERADYRFVGEALASRGVLTLVADYRLYPEVRYPAFLEDGAQAVAFALRDAATWSGNATRVFIVGHSAGAYNAAMLALDGRWLKAFGRQTSELAGWVGLAGPYDFLPIINPDVRPVFFHPDVPPGTQPIDYVGPSSPPAFIGAASNDDLVNPQRNSVGLATRLQAAGRPVTLRVYDRVNHITLAAAFSAPLRWLAPVLADVSAFINAPQ
jgi:acetyl esterase/lipase